MTLPPSLSAVKRRFTSDSSGSSTEISNPPKGLPCPEGASAPISVMFPSCMAVCMIKSLAPSGHGTSGGASPHFIVISRFVWKTVSWKANAASQLPVNPRCTFVFILALFIPSQPCLQAVPLWAYCVRVHVSSRYYGRASTQSIHSP